MAKPKKDNKSEDQNKEPRAKSGFRRYDNSVRDKVIELHRTGMKPKKIVQEIGGHPKVKCVRRWIAKYG
jgi:hypothetical protein